MRVIIIGAGIVGAALAFALGRQGAEVLVIAKGPGPATAASFGWAGASFHLGPAHFALRRESLAAWHRFEAEGAPGLDWQGCLSWEFEGAALDAQASELAALGYPVEPVDAAGLRATLPFLKQVPDKALSFPAEGAMDAGAMAAGLLARAGARLFQGLTVRAIDAPGGQLRGVETDGGYFGADRVVVAAGTGAPALLAPLGVKLPLLPRPGLILRTAPVAPRLGGILVGPFGELRQDREGHLHLPVATSHQSDDAEAIDGAAEALAAAALARLGAHFDLPGLACEQVSLGWRPVPEDGLPVLGPAGPDGLWLAGMHSGVTLAAGVAEGLAREIAGQGEEPLFAPFRPQRFARS